MSNTDKPGLLQETCPHPPRYSGQASQDELRERVQRFTRLTNPDLNRILEGEPSGALPTLEKKGQGQGHSLAHEIARHGPLSLPRACLLFEGCLEHLARGHAAGLVHGGLRPSNLWLEKEADTGQERLRMRTQGDGQTRATSDRQAAPRYFSPEYIRTGRIQASTDIYQVALSLGESILGEPLAQGSDQVARIQAHLEGRLHIPSWLRQHPLGQVLQAALHPDPTQRTPDALSLRRQLRALRDPDGEEEEAPVDTGKTQPLRRGAVLDGLFQLEEERGSGGFATIYKARRLDDHTPVAVKILNPCDNPEVQRRVQERFLREARAAARVQHPDIVKIHEVGLTNGICYMVLEWLQGRDLAEELEERGALPPREALRVTLAALDALDSAHKAGIVHKDIKPGNLFLVSSPGEARVKLLDFGVAHLAAEESMRLTRTGRPACTPAYAAPEYLMRLLVTPAIDVYQVGLLLVELLTGRRAVPHNNPLDCINAHLHGWLEIPPHLQQGPLGPVLARALHQDHSQRFPDAGAFAQALRQASRSLHQPTAQGDAPPPLRVASHRATAPQDQHVVAAWTALDRLMRLHRSQSTDYRAMLSLLRTCLEHGPWPAAAPEWAEVEQILVPLRRSMRYHAPEQARLDTNALCTLLSQRVGRPLRDPTWD